MQNHVLKVILSNWKSAKNIFKSANINGKCTFFEPKIGTFGTRFCTLETLILGFRKIVFDMSSKGLGLE